MSADTLEQRVERLETRLEEVQAQLARQPHGKRGWRWFVGIDADNPHFDEAVRLGREWRNADRPADADGA